LAPKFPVSSFQFPFSFQFSVSSFQKKTAPHRAYGLPHLTSRKQKAAGAPSENWNKFPVSSYQFPEKERGPPN
jgi:hypothetical protein